MALHLCWFCASEPGDEPLHQKGQHGMMPLHLACWLRKPSSVEFILKHSANADTKCEFGMTALHLCWFHASEPEGFDKEGDLAKALVDSSMAVMLLTLSPKLARETGQEGRSVLHVCLAGCARGSCNQNDFEQLPQLGANLICAGKDTITPIHLAMWDNWSMTGASHCLLSDGASSGIVSAQENVFGAMPLH